MLALRGNAEALLDLDSAGIEVIGDGRQLLLARRDLGDPPLELGSCPVSSLLGEFELAPRLGDLRLPGLERLLDGGQMVLALILEVGEQVCLRGVGRGHPSSVIRFIARSANDVGAGGCLSSPGKQIRSAIASQVPEKA